MAVSPSSFQIMTERIPNFNMTQHVCTATEHKEEKRVAGGGFDGGGGALTSELKMAF